ncbi:MAG: Gx transporter family protein [Clostridia bacterium]|nr:Gx transporter family protein [Clostridia bacterium]
MNKLKPKHVSAARYTAVMGLLFASAAVLNWIESIFSAALPAGMRVGLANIVIMAAILTLNLPSAALLVILKSAFVFLSRGFTAGMMSFAGSFLAFAVTALLFRRTKATYILTSVLASAAHSAGQLLTARLLLGTDAVFAYGTLLAFSSVPAGICTGIVLKTVFPRLQKILGNTFESTSSNRED